MWDDMLASEIFQTTTAFLCSEEAGRPCNRPPSASVQFRYTALLLAACAVIKNHIDFRSARHNRGALIIPVMLGMLVGWALGRSFLEVRLNLEAFLLGCDKFVPRTPIVKPAPTELLSTTLGAPPSPPSPPLPTLGFLTGWATEDGYVCDKLTPSQHTVGFRLAYAVAMTVMASVVMLSLEPGAALATFGRSAWRRAAGRHIRSLLQLLSTAFSIVVMMNWNDAMTHWAEDGLNPKQDNVKWRMLFFYSLAMTFGGSAVSVTFQNWSNHLTAVAAASADAATIQASGISLSAKRCLRRPLPTTPPNRRPRPPTAATALTLPVLVTILRLSNRYTTFPPPTKHLPHPLLRLPLRPRVSLISSFPRQVSAKLEVDQQRSRLQRNVLTKLRAAEITAPLSVQRELDLLLDETRVAVGEASADSGTGGTGETAGATRDNSRAAGEGEGGMHERSGGACGPETSGGGSQAALEGLSNEGLSPRGARAVDVIDSLGGSPPQVRCCQRQLSRPFPRLPAQHPAFNPLSARGYIAATNSASEQPTLSAPLCPSHTPLAAHVSCCVYP
jgi:hypothetical protein